MVVGVEKQILCADSTMPKKKQADENQSVTEKQIQIRRANETLIPAISGGRNYTHCTSALRLLTHISKRASVISSCFVKDVFVFSLRSRKLSKLI